MKGRKELHFVHMVVVMVLLGGWAEEGGEGGREGAGGEGLCKSGPANVHVECGKAKAEKKKEKWLCGFT